MRSGANQGQVIRLRDDEPQMNITLLEKLSQDFGIGVGGLDPLPWDEHGVDTQQVFAVMRKAVMGQLRWDVLESAYVDTVGRNKKAIAEYIRNQLAEDKLSDQLTIKEYYDPFTGEPANKSKHKRPHLVGPLVMRCGRQTVSPRLETRPISRSYRASVGHSLYRWY